MAKVIKEFDAVDLTKGLVVEITIKQFHQFRAKLWLVEKLVKLAGIISPIDIELKINREYCGRCGEEIATDEAESCFWCHGLLCYGCWDEHGHCGHEAAEAINEAARMVKQP